MTETTLSPSAGSDHTTGSAEPSAAELQALAQRHLVMHFTGGSAYTTAPPRVIVKGEGSWLTDAEGNRYLDALAGLFCVNIGYGYGAEIGAAVAAQMTELPYYTNWGCAHPPAIKLAAKIAELAPAGLDRVFLTSGGSESNEAAVKLIRQYHQARGEHTRMKFIARRVSYHGTSYAALSLNGMTDFRKTFEPLMNGARHISNTKRYKRPAGETEQEFTKLLLTEFETLIIQEGPDTVAGVFLEPLQNAGGSLTPPAGYHEGMREICDRYGVILVADEVICGFGRLGEWFGSTRYNVQPDIITFAKGVSSAYAPLGGMIAKSEIIDTVNNGPQGMFLHGVTFGGHPTACAAGLANIAIMEREDVLGNVRRTEPYFRQQVRGLLEHALVGDVRGDGFHYSLELVTNKQTREWDSDQPAADFVSTHLGPALVEAGVLCRAAVDHEGTPLIQFSPPLIFSRDDIDTLLSRVRSVLDTAAATLRRGN
ncbi:aspartate aminotransferase family protein [Mycolicibacterium goodii]|uniref:aspartate aminotransferase family protein n=1 Tax=Mycolicibacterium goodii TaxID=134601 RepID=UPI001BDCED91|nr:aspartate aminotransferase family protein [Mycolicibacterium goodii]MBU8819668.1 aspartate aminotransferase family protein [Mycolicibacterium goodii]MBU8833973.1 aspartate aminotransferase family protein [Mycolicibacterium goodii]